MMEMNFQTRPRQEGIYSMGYLDYNSLDKKKRGRKLIMKLAVWGGILTAITVLGFFTSHFVFDKTVMLGDSMGDTLSDQDTILVNQLIYRIKEPERFDVIVFRQGGEEHEFDSIKRIIGKPHETVQIIDGFVYINDVLLEEIIPVEPILIPGLAENKIVLEEDEYFVLGDARNNSEDSRFADIGNIVKKDIIGKAYLRISPSFTIISQNNLKKEEPQEIPDSTDVLENGGD